MSGYSRKVGLPERECDRIAREKQEAEEQRAYTKALFEHNSAASHASTTAAKVRVPRHDRKVRVRIEGKEYSSIADAAAAHNVNVRTIRRWLDGYVDSRGVQVLPVKSCIRLEN